MVSVRVVFQSTHPVWGATSSAMSRATCLRYFNPRTPCGVRLDKLVREKRISIFQSTHPVWGATLTYDDDHLPESISIHAPRVGCDLREGSLSLI